MQVQTWISVLRSATQQRNEMQSAAAPPRWGQVAALVDDMRCFERANPDVAYSPGRHLLARGACATACAR
jgi:hypothetical protein